MLIAIQLELQSASAATLPPFLGRANYAATLARLDALDAALARQVHDGAGQSSGPKPVTCSGLLNGRANRAGQPIAPGASYYVRITGLTTAVSQALDQCLCADRPTTWQLDGHDFQVTDVVCDGAQQPGTGRTGYEALAADPVHYGARPERRVSLRFASPTAFKSGGKHIPIPLPDLVFGSLVERWNAFSPIRLSPEMRRFGAEMIAVSRYRLQSRPVIQKSSGQKQQALRMGGMGDVTYVALGGDRYWQSVMQMLADFAAYSGVGVQTATGMGQARRLARGE